MADPVIRLSGAELAERLRYAGPRAGDDVSITRNGRRLDSKEAVLEWLEEIGPVLDEFRVRLRAGEITGEWLEELDRELDSRHEDAEGHPHTLTQGPGNP